MLTTTSIRRLVLAQWKIDFRKSHLGLLCECRLAGYEPWEGDCVVFISRCRTRLKLIYADSTGLWVGYKQFARGKMATEIEFLERPHTKPIESSDLAMLISGNKYMVQKRKLPWKPRHLDNAIES